MLDTFTIKGQESSHNFTGTASYITECYINSPYSCYILQVSHVWNKIPCDRLVIYLEGTFYYLENPQDVPALDQW